MVHDARNIAGLGGPARIGFQIFTTKTGAAKHNPRHPDIALDMCNKCVAIYNGCSCGPCYCIPFNAEANTPLTCESLCALMNTCPEIGEIEGINLPETICEAMDAAPVIGQYGFQLP